MDTLAEKENTIKVLQSCLNQMSKKKETKGEPKKVETKKKAEIIDVDQDDSNEVRFGCDMCDQTFEDKSDLMIHQDTVHREEMEKRMKKKIEEDKTKFKRVEKMCRYFNLPKGCTEDSKTLSQLNSTKSVHNVSKILHPIKCIKHMKPPKKNDS